MKPVAAALAGAAVALALAAVAAKAETVYKLVDKKGRVTYASEPPRDFDGQVIRLEIKAGPAGAPFDPKSSATRPIPAPDTAKPGDAKANALKEAEERLEAQRRRLQNARDNPGEGDIIRMGKVGGGTRPEFSEAYKRRIAEIESAVKAAEEEVERARRAR